MVDDRFKHFTGEYKEYNVTGNEMKEIFHRAKRFIGDEYRIKDSKVNESQYSIAWQMYSPNFKKLNLAVVYSKINNNFEIIDSSDSVLNG